MKSIDADIKKTTVEASSEDRSVETYLKHIQEVLGDRSPMSIKDLRERYPLEKFYDKVYSKASDEQQLQLDTVMLSLEKMFEGSQATLDTFLQMDLDAVLRDDALWQETIAFMTDYIRWVSDFVSIPDMLALYYLKKNQDTVEASSNDFIKDLGKQLTSLQVQAEAIAKHQSKSIAEDIDIHEEINILSAVFRLFEHTVSTETSMSFYLSKNIVDAQSSQSSLSLSLRKSTHDEILQSSFLSIVTAKGLFEDTVIATTLSVDMRKILTDIATSVDSGVVYRHSYTTGTYCDPLYVVTEQRNI